MIFYKGKTNMALENTLPGILEFTGSEVTEGDFKVALNKLLLYLDEAIGATGGNLFPKRFIGMFSGTEADIPDGWALCNGENGTPDLRGRFIVGAGGGTSYEPGASGGANTATVSISGQTGATTLSVNQMPSHSHTVYGGGSSMDDGGYVTVRSGSSSAYYNKTTSATGSNWAHAHSLSGSATVSTLPPWYALCFIMKL